MSIRRVVPVEQADWGIAPVPGWVEAREPDWHFLAPDGHALAFLLVDEQHHVATQACSSRTVRRLLTPAAVQALAQVQLDFDPGAHRLLIHEVAIWRPGADGTLEKRSAARREAFLLRQREQQLEQQILSGRVSVVALLEDVRVGDAIDVAWTLEPLDPLPGLRFTTFFAFVWSVPVARAAFTLHLSDECPVRWRMHAPDGVTPPQLEAQGQRLTWRVERPSIFEPEPNVPAGHWPFPVLDVSAWESWSQVADFFAQLWSDALGQGAELVDAEAARLGAARAPADAVRAAIRFVQEEIRYLAVDFGSGAGLLPDGAGTVLRRRFGDCKDKAVLLTALLRALGVEAWPLLVGAGWREAVARVQPSNAAFSHAIVTFVVGDRRCFVDPTVVGQGGDLERLVAPPFGFGLEVRPGPEGLVPLPELPAADLTLTEIFHLDRAQRDGAVEQALRASAWIADDVRAALVHQGRAAFVKARTEALQRHFPALRPGDDSVVVEDDSDANVLELRARYGLPTWGAPGERPPDQFSYGAHGLFLAVERVEGPEKRRQAWALRFPLKVHHRVVVRGSCVRKTVPELHRFSGPGFRYSCEVTPRRHEVTFDYRWETTQHEVAPHEWTEYCRQRSKALEHAGANVATPAWSPVTRTGLGWSGVGAVVAVVLLGRLATTWTDRASRTPESRPPSAASREALDRDLSEAWEAVARGDYLQAEPLIERARASHAENPRFHHLRAEVAVRTGRFDRAREALATAKRLDPVSVVPDLIEAFLDETLGDVAAARRALERALLRDPDNSRALYDLARVAEQMGDDGAARSVWERVLARNPLQPEALFRRSFLLWRGGERERADTLITGAIRGQSTSSAGLESALTRYYSATGRHTEAVEPARRAAELAPQDPRVAGSYAFALARVGDRSGALSVARRMLAEFPKAPEAWSAMATISAVAGDAETADPAFRTWLELAPDDPDAYANYAILLNSTGRSREAVAMLEEATRRFPGHGATWQSYAVVLDEVGRTSEAAQARARAEALLEDEQRATMMR